MFVRIVTDRGTVEYVNINQATRIVKSDRLAAIDLPGQPVSIAIPASDFEANVLPAMQVAEGESRPFDRLAQKAK